MIQTNIPLSSSPERALSTAGQYYCQVVHYEDCYTLNQRGAATIKHCTYRGALCI